MYTIKVTRPQYEFIRAALNQFHQDCVNALDHQIDPFPPAVTVTVDTPVVKAKYGYKADGTPRKAPGRPARKAK